MVFVVFAMRLLVHFYYAFSSSFFHKECGDVPLLTCSSHLQITHFLAKAMDSCTSLLALQPRLLSIVFSLSRIYYKVAAIVTGKWGECDAKSR